VGVSPDIEVPISDAEERRVVLAEAKRPLTPEEQAEAAKAEDRQLERAVSSLRSVLIYKARQAALNVPKPAPPKSADGATPDAAR
jgi:hypothetical protein